MADLHQKGGTSEKSGSERRLAGEGRKNKGKKKGSAAPVAKIGEYCRKKNSKPKGMKKFEETYGKEFKKSGRLMGGWEEGGGLSKNLYQKVPTSLEGAGTTLLGEKTVVLLDGKKGGVT